MMRVEIARRTFQWDAEKARRNKLKHGISFETAALVFEDENRIQSHFPRLRLGAGVRADGGKN